MDEKFEVRDLRSKDRFFLDDAFFNGYVKILGTNALGVYCSLCRHADKNQKCFPSMGRIAQELNISRPTVAGCVSVLEYFSIIKKIRVGKQCTNRYHLIDKKQWRKDWDVMLTELTTGDVNLDNFRNKPSLLQVLTQLTSNNSKETQEKGNTKEGNNIKIISEGKINSMAEDVLDYFSSATKREKGFRPKLEKKRDLGYITKFLEGSARGGTYRVFDGSDLKKLIDFFLRNNDQFKKSYICIPNIICSEVYERWQREDPQEVLKKIDAQENVKK